MTKKIVVVRAGGHGKLVTDSLLVHKEYELAGFLDDAYPKVSDVWGFPVLGKVGADTLSSLQRNVANFVVAIGNNTHRESVFKLTDGLGFVPSIVYPNALFHQGPYLVKVVSLWQMR